MVIFNDIHIEDGVITAIVVDGLYDVTEVLNARLDGTYNSSLNPNIVKATNSLICEYFKIGILPKNTIAHYN